MPVSLSGVMLVEYRVPNGSTKARPPAKGAPPSAVWQAAQSAARVEIFAALNETRGFQFGRNTRGVRRADTGQRHVGSAREVHGVRREHHHPQEADKHRGENRGNADQSAMPGPAGGRGFSHVATIELPKETRHWVMIRLPTFPRKLVQCGNQCP